MLSMSSRGGFGPRQGGRQIATALFVGSVCTFFLQQALGVNAGKLGVVASRMLSRPVLVTALGIVLAGVPLVGLVSFPMLGGLVFGRRPETRARRGRRTFIGLGIFLCPGATGLP